MTKLCLAAKKKNVEINCKEHILSCHDGCERMVDSNKYLHMLITHALLLSRFYRAIHKQ